MTFTVWRRHNRAICQSTNRYEPRCKCPLHVQFVWKGALGVFEGKRLAYQNKWSLETRSWAEAQDRVKSLEKRLKDFADGKVVPTGMSVEATLQEWYQFRSQNGLDNTKAKLMGGKLLAWCEQHGVLILSALTTDRLMKWRLTLPFRSGNSSSLAVHWSVISGFFSWAEGMGYIDRTPVPNPKLKPQFRIKVEKDEVVPPTREEVEKMLATADGLVRTLCWLMRETAMALVDAVKLGMPEAYAKKHQHSKPERRPSLTDGVIRGSRTKTNERYRVRISDSLSKELSKLPQPLFPGTLVQWRERVNKVIKDAGVDTTPHGFRHYRITEWLSAGVQVDDVADMVGTSSKEIRKTYRHWVKEVEDRLDEVQRQVWLKMGLDEQGNAIGS